MSAAIRAVRAENEKKKRTAFVVTFGCQQNEADSERMRGLCRTMGYDLTDVPEGADLILVNTCAVRDHAERKVFSLLGTYKKYKEQNPALLIGVCGCMAAESGAVTHLKNGMHYVSFTLEPHAIYRLPERIAAAMFEGKRGFAPLGDAADIAEDLPAVRRERHRAFVPVMYGCNNFCTYCIVPYTRGRERSREAGRILDECRTLLRDGCREITFLGQNVNSYRDGETDFAALLERAAEIPGDFILRFMTSHPKDVSDRLISVMSRCVPKVAPCFHLPLQSGSDAVLRAMHRTYDREHYLEIEEKLRDAVPGIALSTDVIVGFPGERDEDFEDTLAVLSGVRFDNVYSFLYSKREGTRAATMEKQVPESVKSARMARLLSLQDGISRERAAAYVGKTLRVLCDGADRRGGENLRCGKSATGYLVHFPADEDPTGTFVNVKIDRTGSFELYGTVIKEISHDENH